MLTSSVPRRWKFSCNFPGKALQFFDYLFVETWSLGLRLGREGEILSLWVLWLVCVTVYRARTRWRRRRAPPPPRFRPHLHTPFYCTKHSCRTCFAWTIHKSAKNLPRGPCKPFTNSPLYIDAYPTFFAIVVWLKTKCTSTAFEWHVSPWNTSHRFFMKNSKASRVDAVAAKSCEFFSIISLDLRVEKRLLE